MERKILIVEDDMALREELRELLRTNGYAANAVSDFEGVLGQIRGSEADLVLLDINLPGQSGELLLRELRKTSAVPVIMLTSRTQETDEVLSMSYGADDYITKPYNPTILLLRIAAVFRRMEPAALDYRGMQVNAAKGCVSRGEEELILTKNEMILFEQLLANQGRIVSRDALMTVLWDNGEFVSDNALTVNISRLRAKLAGFGCPGAIETRKKQGYVLL